MNGDAVREIAELKAEAQTKTIHVDGAVYTTRELHQLPRRKEEAVEPIRVKSVKALCDWVTNNTLPIGSFVHIVSPTLVEIRGPLIGTEEGTNQRHTYLQAEFVGEPWAWGKYLSTEEWVVALQARFDHTDDRDRAAAILGNLVHEEVLKLEDDGTTQRATARTGIAKVSEVSVRNPFWLAPMRCFYETSPVASPFVLRMKQEGGWFRAAFFEADGGKWQVQSIEGIRFWIESQIGDDMIPIIG